MTARQARNQRRAAERQANKAAAKNGTPVESVSPSPVSLRAEANRQNAQFSTGPRTEEGKAKSSRNAFKHGLYSQQLVLPNEDPAQLDELRAELRAEHQPANTTEEILVNELAEHFWRLRRMRKYETHALQPDKIQDWIELLPMIQRTMASAERGFHKALTALTRLQKERGFVPAKAEPKTEDFTAQAVEPGFVPTKTQTAVGFVPQNQHELSPGEALEFGLEHAAASEAA